MGAPPRSNAASTRGNFSSTSRCSTAWSTADASIEFVKYPGTTSSHTEDKHQNAASSSISSSKSAAMKFIPWQYPTLGLCRAYAQSTRRSASRPTPSRRGCAGNVRGRSFEICSRARENATSSTGEAVGEHADVDADVESMGGARGDLARGGEGVLGSSSARAGAAAGAGSGTGSGTGPGTGSSAATRSSVSGESSSVTASSVSSFVSSSASASSGSVSPLASTSAR